jgi:hypothetical protein
MCSSCAESLRRKLPSGLLSKRASASYLEEGHSYRGCVMRLNFSKRPIVRNQYLLYAHQWFYNFKCFDEDRKVNVNILLASMKTLTR